MHCRRLLGKDETMDRREFLIGASAMIAGGSVAPSSLIPFNFATSQVYVMKFDDARVLLPNTNRFRYLSDND